MSDPDIAAHGGTLEQAAVARFEQFASIVQECQSSADFTQTSTVALTGLLYASVHGLIDLEACRRMRQEKGLNSVAESANLLINLLSQGSKKSVQAPLLRTGDRA